MPVPASYNDITEDSELRDHVGTVWYDRKFFIPNTWIDKKVWIRFGSVHYEAFVVSILYIKLVLHNPSTYFYLYLFYSIYKYIYIVD